MNSSNRIDTENAFSSNWAVAGKVDGVEVEPGWERVGWVGRGAALGKAVLAQTIFFPVCSPLPAYTPNLWNLGCWIVSALHPSADGKG